MKDEFFSNLVLYRHLSSFIVIWRGRTRLLSAVARIGFRALPGTKPAAAGTLATSPGRRAVAANAAAPAALKIPAARHMPLGIAVPAAPREFAAVRLRRAARCQRSR